MVSVAPAGWYSDPSGRAPYRFWDGQAWTNATSPRPASAPPPASGLSYRDVEEFLAERGVEVDHVRYSEVGAFAEVLQGTGERVDGWVVVRGTAGEGLDRDA